MLNTASIDNVINNFLDEEGFDCYAEISTDFDYCMSKSLIHYSIIQSEKMSKMFLDFVKTLNFNVDCGYFILAFFHELGHNETLHLFSEKEIKKDDKAKKKLFIENDEDIKAYFALPTEIIATRWAIDYISNNLEKVQKFAAEVQNEILNFIKKYQITI